MAATLSLDDGAAFNRMVVAGRCRRLSVGIVPQAREFKVSSSIQSSKPGKCNIDLQRERLRRETEGPAHQFLSVQRSP
jgi:hypothetical protein